MSDTPPVKYAAYPRENSVSTYGTLEKLEALGSGYFGLVTIWAVNLVAVVAGNALALGIHSFPRLALIVFLVLTFGALSYPQNKKIAYGMGWSNSKAILASVLIGGTSFFCYAVIGFLIIQNSVARELKRYGVTLGSFGQRKSEFRAAVEARRHAENLPPPPI